jgi:nucleoprotein TPR
MERINQLTLLRESNAALRAECETQTRRARALDTQLQQLQSELEPAHEQLRVARAELEARTEQVTRLEQECRSWQERNKQLLTKVGSAIGNLHVLVVNLSTVVRSY